ncbi:hypothetical protein [Ferrimonas lipolytica]|uniref:Uncharacterized protein n=1 Tax=Ferrimonas lipolytica TaxID=2724191 RepID=A0A6H1UFS5_9GAMM|nr:hypothetical protein [Ferrimonas lipolytica]QIZ77678.1 hypothetical protein HER31_12695 [Ferrimonas lipolytica]
MSESGELRLLGSRLWLGAKFGLAFALLMLALLTIYELITTPDGIYFSNQGVQWLQIGEYLLSWGPPLIALNVIVGALHYCRAPHEGN